MKNLLLALLVLFSTTLYGQQEFGSVNKNTVTYNEVSPVWPGCEKEPTSNLQNCFTQNLTKNITKNYRYPPEAYKKNEQGKVVVEFYINKEGMVEIENVSGGTPLLRAEAKRNILSIPKMAKPGTLGGKPRAIKYTVPFTFKTGK